MSLGKDGTLLSQSIFEGRKSALGTTVTKEDSMVLCDTSLFDPVGSKGLGCGGECSRNWNVHMLTYPEEVSRDRSPVTVLTW